MCIFGGGDGWMLFMGLPLLFIFLSSNGDNDSESSMNGDEPNTAMRGQPWICPNEHCRCPNSPQARFCKRCRTPSRTRVIE